MANLHSLNEIVLFIFKEMELSHMDEFIDELLREDRACDVILPRIQVRTRSQFLD